MAIKNQLVSVFLGWGSPQVYDLYTSFNSKIYEGRVHGSGS